MSELKATCIYCQQAIEPQRGEGDHVIPDALGRFEGEFRFRSICQGCNSLIGKCEEQLLRCAPEAYFRRLVQPIVKRNNRGKGWVGANGMPPPEFMIDHGDHHELVNGSTDDPRNVYPVDQLVIVDEDKGEHHIRLFPKMTAARLRAKIEALGVLHSDRSYLHADEATYPAYIALLKEIPPGWTFSEAEDLEPGTHRVKGRTTFTFHDDYWRAIAKIGFHYYLVNSCRGKRGDEPEFAAIRRYIMEGGDREPFFTQPAAQFALPFGELLYGSAVLLPHTWAHILAADETANAAVAMVSLFMGPEHLAPTYHINLGRFASPLIVPRARFAHAFIYDVEPSNDGYTGRVVAKSLRQLEARFANRR